jgi:peroxiredoxin
VHLSDYRGKVVLVNIWATWCRPCVEEMPSMQKLYDEFKRNDFEILAISIDATGESVVAPFMQKYKLTFPALIDSEGTIRESYGATGVPESFIIDRQGILVKKIIGAADWSSPAVFRFFSNLLQKPLSQK